MRGLKADIYTGMKDDPLAKLHLGDALRNLPTESLTLGPRGEEVHYFGVRTFPSGDSVGLFGVWPGRESHVYAIVLDEKFPEYFGLFFLSSSSPEKQNTNGRDWLDSSICGMKPSALHWRKMVGGNWFRNGRLRTSKLASSALLSF
jgi:hypothetical protein